MAGLYLHIPFCSRKCHYCNFVITRAGSAEKHSHFLDALEREMDAAAPLARGLRFETLYVGGGTPSALSIGESRRVLAAVGRCFDVASDAEITWEANPADTHREKAAAWKSFGVNRVSLGAQSFHDDTLKRLNRDHDAAGIREAFGALRAEGFSNVSLDLMLSLPGDTLDRVRESLEAAVELSPEHISLYELVIEPGTVFERLFKRGRLALPKEDTELEALVFARDFLKEKGYTHYELLSYAKSGYASRHNLIYWKNEEYLSFGPGATSYRQGRRWKTALSVEEYMKKAEKGDWTAAEEETLAEDKKEIESLLLALRLSEGVSIARFAKTLNALKPAVDGLVVQGLVVHDGAKLKLTPRGQFFAETVFTELSAV